MSEEGTAADAQDAEDESHSQSARADVVAAGPSRRGFNRQLLVPYGHRPHPHVF